MRSSWPLLAFVGLQVVSFVFAQGTCGCAPKQFNWVQYTFPGNITDLFEIQKKAPCPHFVNHCDKGFVCPPSRNGRCGSSLRFAPPGDDTSREAIEITPPPGDGTPRLEAIEIKCHGSLRLCERPGARNDPHITGFDGSKFDFHGVPKRTYAIFGRIGGDLLVARMRGSGYKQFGGRKSVAKTYFNEFGLRISENGPKVHVVLVRDSHLKWTSRVTVNGRVIKNNYNGAGISVRFAKRGIVQVASKEVKYHFSSLRLSDRRHRHLDVAFELLQTPQRSHKYVGIVGITLNHALGHTNVDKNLNWITRLRTTSRRQVQKWTHSFEMTLRRLFEVNLLFPQTTNHGDALSIASSRIAVKTKNSNRLVASVAQ